MAGVLLVLLVVLWMRKRKSSGKVRIGFLSSLFRFANHSMTLFLPVSLSLSLSLSLSFSLSLSLSLSFFLFFFLRSFLSSFLYCCSFDLFVVFVLTPRTLNLS